MSFLTGKPASSTSTSTSSSSNVNNPLITNAYGGTVSAGTDATDRIKALLTGGGDAAGAQQGYNNYLQMAGYAPAMRQLSEGITGQGAASGLLRSGATVKALQSRGADLNSQYFNNYLQNLQNLSGQGLQAGGLIANTGQVSNSSSTSNQKGGSPGALASIGQIVGGAASIFSDRRLKKDIVRIGEFSDGLGKYLYRYVWDVFGTRREGVMADEVEKIRPWALGPKIAGFATVNYGVL